MLLVNLIKSLLVVAAFLIWTRIPVYGFWIDWSIMVGMMTIALTGADVSEKLLEDWLDS